MYKRKMHHCSSLDVWINIDLFLNLFIIGEKAEDVRATDDSERNNSLVYYFKNKQELNEALELRALEHSKRETIKNKLKELNLSLMEDLKCIMDKEVLTIAAKKVEETKKVYHGEEYTHAIFLEVLESRFPNQCERYKQRLEIYGYSKEEPWRYEQAWKMTYHLGTIHK